MTYVDGFVCPVQPGRKDDYIKMAERAAPLFIEYGALRVVETWNDDLMVGKTNDFRSAVIAEEGEDVVFSWVEWPDKETRNKGWEAMMKDERMKGPDDHPMIGARMIYGGFTTILDRTGK
jgi:uncharacterized protein YbaA (DUF1428 family)